MPPSSQDITFLPCLHFSSRSPSSHLWNLWTIRGRLSKEIENKDRDSHQPWIIYNLVNWGEVGMNWHINTWKLSPVSYYKRQKHGKCSLKGSYSYSSRQDGPSAQLNDNVMTEEHSSNMNKKTVTTVFFKGRWTFTQTHGSQGKAWCHTHTRVSKYLVLNINKVSGLSREDFSASSKWLQRTRSEDVSVCIPVLSH